MNPAFKEVKDPYTNFWNWRGLKVYWRVIGEGNKYPIIFLHGFGASSKHWRKNLKYFERKNFAVYSLDLVGFGNSDQPGIREFGKLDNEVWSNQVKDFISEIIKPLNSNKVILIGNSLGALVALTCAVSIEDEILTVIAAPLPDQIKEIYKQKLVSPLFQNLSNKLVNLFFIFLPLEIILFFVNKFGILKIGLNSAYFKKK